MYREAIIIDMYGQPVCDDVYRLVMQQTLWFNDLSGEYFFFDFQLPDGTWCGGHKIDLEKKEVIVQLYKPDYR